MLVLSRKKGQRVVIDDRIEVVILESSSSKVIIGIVAPNEVPVHREEVYRRIHGGDDIPLGRGHRTQARTAEHRDWRRANEVMGT